MNKLILTCFLALLCLVGRYLAASSRVADSPPEVPLHRSASVVSPHSGDTHRGGAILPDTFTRIDFGLVDSDQDMGAGEEGVILQPAPVTVSASKLTQISNSPNQLSLELSGEEGFKLALHSRGLRTVDSEPKHETASIRTSSSSDVTSLASWFLPLESSSQAENGMIYLEIASPTPPDTLWITFWEHLLSDAPSVTPGNRIPLIAEKGTFFEGSAGNQVFSLPFPEELESGFISIATGKSTLAEQWSFTTGDRVRIRFDLQKGKALFGGPKAAFYQTQYLLDQAFEEEKFNSNPILIANRSEGLFADDASGAAYRKAKGKAQDIHVSMQVLVPIENGWDHLQDYMNKPLDQHPAFTILENASAKLTDWEREKLNSRVKGQILRTATKRAERIADQLAADQEKGKALLDWSQKLKLNQVKSSHPLLVQGVTGLEILQSKINSVKVLDQLIGYPTSIKDELLGYFLLSNYNRLKENLDSYLLVGIDQVNTPWIKSRLEYLHQVQLGPFLSEGLYDIEGRKVDLSQFKGKTLLLHFWISGCKFCKDDYELVLKPLQELLESNDDILLVTVNADGGEGSWKTSLATGHYTSPAMLNLRAEKGIGVLDRYKIHSFPQKMIIGPDSKIRLQILDKMGPVQLQSLLHRTQSNSELTFSSTQPH